MTDATAIPYGHPITAPFWEAAWRRVLLVQRCQDCHACQFYPRPFCLACESRNLGWVDAGGMATIYALTTVRLRTTPELEPPYLVALVDLDEGARMLGNVIGDTPVIGDRVRLAVETFGDLHVLVNNAGILRDRTLANMTEAEWDAVIRVHLKGHAAPIAPPDAADGDPHPRRPSQVSPLIARLAAAGCPATGQVFHADSNRVLVVSMPGIAALPTKLQPLPDVYAWFQSD